MQYIKYQGEIVPISDYVRAKTESLVDFGYTKLTEQEVLDQVNLILAGKPTTTVIGAFCKDDFEIT